jgi:hypothetical protein
MKQTHTYISFDVVVSHSPRIAPGSLRVDGAGRRRGGGGGGAEEERRMTF